MKDFPGSNLCHQNIKLIKGRKESIKRGEGNAMQRVGATERSEAGE
jgi:hypothetical protein